MIKFTQCPKPCKNKDCSDCPVYQAYLIGIDYGMQKCDGCKFIENITKKLLLIVLLIQTMYSNIITRYIRSNLWLN